MKVISYFFAAVFYIYVLYSNRSDRYYTGLTSDVERRLHEHNNPTKFDKYTPKHLPWELKLSFACSELRGEALIIERFIKKQKSRFFIDNLIRQNDNPDNFKDFIVNILNRR